MDASGYQLNKIGWGSKVAMIAILVLGGTIAPFPATLALGRGNLILYLFIGSLVTNSIYFLRYSKPVWEKPSMREYLLAGLGAVYQFAIIGLIFWICYWIGYGLVWLVDWIISWFIPAFQPNLDQIALTITLIISAPTAIGIFVFAAQQLSDLLYPGVPGVRSPYYDLVTYNIRRLLVGALVSLVILIALWGWFSLRGQMGPTYYVVMQVYILIASLPVWSTGYSTDTSKARIESLNIRQQAFLMSDEAKPFMPELKSTPFTKKPKFPTFQSEVGEKDLQETRIITDIASLLSKTGFKVSLIPKFDDPDIDSKLINVDILGERNGIYALLQVKQGDIPASDVDYTSLVELVSAAGTLCEKRGIRPDHVISLLVLVDVPVETEISFKLYIEKLPVKMVKFSKDELKEYQEILDNLESEAEKRSMAAWLLDFQQETADPSATDPGNEERNG